MATPTDFTPTFGNDAQAGTGALTGFGQQDLPEMGFDIGLVKAEVEPVPTPDVDISSPIHQPEMQPQPVQEPPTQGWDIEQQSEESGQPFMSHNFPYITQDTEQQLAGVIKKHMPDASPMERFEKAKELIEQKYGQQKTAREKKTGKTPTTFDKLKSNILTAPVARGVGTAIGTAKGVFEGVKDVVTERIPEIGRSIRDIRTDPNVPASDKLGRTVIEEIFSKGLIGAPLEIAGGGLMGALEGATSRDEQVRAQKQIEDAVAIAVETPEAQEMIQRYVNLPTERREELDRAVTLGGNLFELRGAGVGKKAVKPLQDAITKALKAAGNQIDEVAKLAARTGEAAARTVGEAGEAIGRLTKPAGEAITDTTKALITKVSGMDTKTVDTILDQPQLMEDVINGVKTLDGETDNLLDSIGRKAAELSEEGGKYQAIREMDVNISGEGIRSKVDDLLKGRDIGIKNGRLDFTRSAIGGTKRKAIQELYDEVVRVGDYTARDILNLRGRIDDVVDSVEGAKGKVKSIATAMRRAVDDEAKTMIPGLRELDAKYSSDANFLKSIKKDFLNRDGTPKDNIQSILYGLTTKAKKGKLDRLKRVIPDIETRINALRAVDDIARAQAQKTGAYVQSMFFAAGMFTGNPLVGIAAGVFTSPKTVTNMLLKYAKSKKGVSKVIDKIEAKKTLTDSDLKVVDEALSAQEKAKVQALAKPAEAQAPRPDVEAPQRQDIDAPEPNPRPDTDIDIPQEAIDVPEVRREVLEKDAESMVPIIDAGVPSQSLLNEAAKYETFEEFLDVMSDNLVKSRGVMGINEFSKKIGKNISRSQYNKIKEEMPFMLEGEGEFITGIGQRQLDELVDPKKGGRHGQLKQIREQAKGK